MALMTGLNSAISGLDSQQTLINVTGSNLANSTTPGFKVSSVSFQSLLSQTISFGSAPVGGGLGGTNPLQIGLGAQVAAINRDFSQGELETTGVNTNLAINGNGFFRLDSTGTGNIVYTRDGSFSLSAPVPAPATAPVGTLPQNFLVNAQGYKLQGINATNPQTGNFTIPSGSPPSAINIPIGLGISAVTANVNFAGNLNGGGTPAPATGGTVLTSGALTTGGVPATGATLLTTLDPPLSIVAGDVIKLTGTVGGRSVTKSLTVAAGTTVDALTNPTTGLIERGLGIGTAGDPGAIVNPGNVTIGPPAAAGVITVTGNTGTANAITSLTLTNTGQAGAVKNTALAVFTTTNNASGESTSTDFTVYDTSGNPHIVTLTTVLETAAAAGNTWRYYIDSSEVSGLTAAGDRFVSTGTIGFNASGQVTTGTSSSITLPTTIPVIFNTNFGAVTDFGSSTSSSISMSSQDGFAFGTLNNFSIGQDGTVTGIFSNGITRPVAQVQLATFSNPNGLQATTNNDYIATASSGPQTLALPTQNGGGSLVGGALEASNVDVAKEITNLIVGQRAFQADARVIQTASTMLQELLTTIAA